MPCAAFDGYVTQLDLFEAPRAGWPAEFTYRRCKNDGGVVCYVEYCTDGRPMRRRTRFDRLCPACLAAEQGRVATG